MFMRKPTNLTDRHGIFRYVEAILVSILLASVVSGGTGCQSMKSKSQPSSSRGWLTPAPNKKSTTPSDQAVRGQAAGPADFSSSDVSIAPYNPAGPVAPVLSAPAATAQAPPAAAPVAASPPETAPLADPWGVVIAPSNAPAPGVPSLTPPEALLPGSQASSLPPPPTGGPSQPAYGNDWDDPWGFGFPEGGARNAVSIEEAAKKEDEQSAKLQEQERKRLEELAKAKQTADHLQPLPPWSGPFESREKKQTIEQDIIRQVGLVEVVPERFDNSPVYDWEKEQEKGFDWSVLDPVNFFNKMRDLAGMGPDERKAKAAMEKGRELLLENRDLKDRKKSLEAAKHFKEAAKRWPDSVIEEDALHLAGECYFFGDDYPRSMEMYQKLLVKYQHSKYIDGAVRRLFKIAKFWEEEDRRGVSFINPTDKSRPTFDTFGHCEKAYQTIYINDPNGPISDDAVMSLAMAHLVKGRYQGDISFDRAASLFKYLRETYPLSRHIAKAYEHEVYARSNAYMGADYSGDTLDEAGKLADMTLRQFSGEMENEDKDEVLRLKEAVIDRQAEREWALGQYYERKKLYGAARISYEKLLDKYPQTVLAEQARERLEVIRDRPEKPDQYEFFKKLVMPRENFMYY